MDMRYDCLPLSVRLLFGLFVDVRPGSGNGFMLWLVD